MAKKNPYSNLHQMEFDLLCLQNLRYGLACSGDWDWVLRADAIIADLKANIATARKRLAANPRPPCQ